MFHLQNEQVGGHRRQPASKQVCHLAESLLQEPSKKGNTGQHTGSKKLKVPGSHCISALIAIKKGKTGDGIF